MVEHSADNRETWSSILLSPTMLFYKSVNSDFETIEARLLLYSFLYGLVIEIGKHAGL